MLLSFSITVCAQTPVYQSSVVNNATPTRLEMTYNVTLANIISAASSFNVLVNSGSTPVTAVAISDKKVLLFLMNPVKNGDVISVSYTRPSINPVQSTTNVLAASLASQNVTNNVIAVTPFLYDNTGTAYYVKGVGFQIWMGGNLATTNYNDGTSIPNVTDQATWRALTTPAWCWYNNSDVNREMGYGALYNWYTINTGKLCPTGWHVPSTGEWVKLVTFLGDSLTAGGKLKEAGTAHWASPNINATNETGFSALPGGLRDNTGGFDDIGITGLWWSTTVNHSYTNVSWNRIMHSDNAYAYINASVWPYGCSVRCLQNVQPIAEISGTTSICINAAQPNITFTGITGTAPFTFTYSINSGSNQTVTTISGNSVTVSVPTGIAGTYTYSLVSVQDAYSTIAQTGSATIIVNPLPTANAGAALIVICQGGTSAALGGSVGGSATGGTWSTPVGGTFSPNATTLNATWTPPGTYSGTATLTLTTTGGSCGVASASKTQIVTANNAISLSSAAGTNAQTTCINTAITPITYTTTGATGASVSNLPTGVSGVWSGNVVTISGTPTVAGAARTYTVTLTGGCGVVTSTGTMTVTANNTVNRTSSVGTDAQTVCINTAITSITYATTGVTGATVTGLPAGVTGLWAANVVTISGTPTASVPFTYTITLTGGCGVITTTGTITVTANNTVNRTSPVGTDAQTVCINTAITNITYATTGATGATVTGLPAGVTGLWAANVVTISGTPTAAGPFTYTVTLTGCCGVITTTGTITVTANNTVNRTSPVGTDAQTVCINTAITNITYATTGATGATVTGLPAGVTGSWLANVVTISGTPTASGPFTYTVTLTGGCGVMTTTGTITVTANNTVSLTSAASTNSQTKCINRAITNITYSTTGVTGATVTGLPAGVTGTWFSNVVTISGTPTAAGPFTYTVTLTGGCGAITTTGTLTVTANNTVNGTSPVGTDAQTVCINTAITNITYATTGATGATVTGLPAGVTGTWLSNVVTISGTPTAAGSFTYTVTLTGGCGAVTTTGTITVTPNNTVTLTSAAGTDAQTKCINRSEEHT